METYASLHGIHELRDKERAEARERAVKSLASIPVWVRRTTWRAATLPEPSGPFNASSTSPASPVALFARAPLTFNFLPRE